MDPPQEKSRWNRNGIANDVAIDFVNNIEGYTGAGAVKFIVTENDMIQNGNRSELTISPYHPEGTESWYSWRFMIDPSYEDYQEGGESRDWQIIGQWHDTYDNNQPSSENNVPTNGPIAQYEYRYDKNTNQRYLSLWHGVHSDDSRFDHYKSERVAEKPIQKGRWYRVVTHIKWSMEEDEGYIESWVDGVPFGQRDYGRNMSNRIDAFFKLGLYRGTFWRDMGRVHTLYYDDFKLSTSSLLEEVNESPQVSLTNPSTGAFLTIGNSVTVSAEASDPDGQVQQVVFYAGGNEIGTDNTAPYAINWTPEVPGDFAIEAKATDDKGTSTTSLAVPVTVTAGGCIAAIASGHDGNGPENVLDNDRNSRWSAQGDGQWIQFCLGDVAQKVEAVDIAFYNGDQRITTFDIQLSLDQQNWQTVGQGLQSSGTSTALEHFAFTPQYAKYVRITGHGNNSPTSSQWNSLTEVEVILSTAQTCVVATPDSWQNISLSESLDGTFTAEADVTPSQTGAAAAISLAAVTSTDSWASLATTVLFSDPASVPNAPENSILVRNGIEYTADATLIYEANRTYHVRFVVNVAEHTYSVYVTPEGENEILLAANYQFRDGQQSLNQLTTWNISTGIGAVEACNFTISQEEVADPPVISGEVDIRRNWESGVRNPDDALLVKEEAAQFEVVGDDMPFSIRQGNYAARFTVRPGDQYSDKSGERSEIELWSYDREQPGDEYYYGWSTLFPQDWPEPARWGIILQWHAHTSISPPVGINATGNSLSVDYCSGNIDNAYPCEKDDKFLVLDNLNKGKWNDFIIRIKFAPDETGLVQLWHRLEGESDFQLIFEKFNYPTLQWATDLGMIESEYAIDYTVNGVDGYTTGTYLHHGFYRGAGDMTNTLYHDGFCRGTSLEAVKSCFDSSGVDPEPGCYTATSGDGGWKNVSLEEDAGQVFTAEADVTPSALGAAGALALTSDGGTSWNDLATTVLFSDPVSEPNAPENSILVRNGDLYTADNILIYEAGRTYHVRMEVDISDHKYSVFVTPEGGNEVALATDYSFRTSQQFASFLNTWTVATGNASFEACNFTNSLPAPCHDVTASSDDGNVPENVLDDNYSTRWSALGDGQWIQFCLGSVKTVEAVDIAFHQGNERTMDFDIATSNDSENWTSVAAGLVSSGNTLQMQRFAFEPHDAKYVRITGHGNSINDWNSLTEVDIVTESTLPDNPLEPVTLITLADNWHYLDNGSDQTTTDWKQLNGTGTSTWSVGQAPLGYGNGDENTEVSYGPDYNNKYTTTYFYKDVEIDQHVQEREYKLKMRVDDGAVIYINGVEGKRINMPDGDITYTTRSTGAAPDDGDALHTFSLPANMFSAGPNRVAVEVHQTSAGSSDLTFTLELIGDVGTDPDLPDIDGSTLVRQPYLQVGTSESMTIRWRTSIAMNSRVWYGASPNQMDLQAGSEADVTDHEIKLAGLQPNTKYYYAIGASDKTLQVGSENFFITSPLVGSQKKTRIWATGDCGNGSTNQRNVRDQYLNYLSEQSGHTDVWLLLGDNAYTSGADWEYQERFFDIYEEKIAKNTVLWPSPGNHDYNNGSTHERDVPYYDIFTMPRQGEAGGEPSNTEGYYSYDYANIHFISLDSHGYDYVEGSSYNLDDVDGPQVQWLIRDLEANTQKWTIVYWHHPPYSKGGHDSDEEGNLRKLRERLLPVLESYNVDLVLCGHSHSYERSKLLKGHTGMERDFDPSVHNLSNSSGKNDGSTNSAPYIKSATNGYEGTVYVVAGSAGAMKPGVSPGDDDYGDGFPHNALPFGNDEIGGSFVIEVEGDRLDAKWLCSDGVIRDKFTMFKYGNGSTSSAKTRTMAANEPVDQQMGEESETIDIYPNPFSGETTLSYSVTEATHVKLLLYTLHGDLVDVLVSEKLEKGSHTYKLNANQHELKEGTYIVHLATQAGQSAKRIIYINK